MLLLFVSFVSYCVSKKIWTRKNMDLLGFFFFNGPIFQGESSECVFSITHGPEKTWARIIVVISFLMDQFFWYIFFQRGNDNVDSKNVVIHIVAK